MLISCLRKGIVLQASVCSGDSTWRLEMICSVFFVHLVLLLAQPVFSVFVSPAFFMFVPIKTDIEVESG